MNDLKKLAEVLEKAAETGQVTGFTHGERVYVLLNDKPDQLRQIADLIESMGLNGIHAVVSYPKPTGEILPLTSSDSTSPSSENDQTEQAGLDS